MYKKTYKNQPVMKIYAPSCYYQIILYFCW